MSLHREALARNAAVEDPEVQRLKKSMEVARAEHHAERTRETRKALGKAERRYVAVLHGFVYGRRS